MGATGGASGTSAPRSSATTWPSERIPNTVIPGTIDASLAWGSGTNTRAMPRCAAASTIGRTPGTDRRPPDRVSSPTNAVPARALAGTRSAAASTETAMARSKCVPLLVRSAGASRTVTRRVIGHSSPLLIAAIRHRSRASLSETSGRPINVVPTVPGETSACTSIRCPSAPCRLTVWAVANGISPPRARGRRSPGPWPAGAPRPGRPGVSSATTSWACIQAWPSRWSRSSLASVIASWGVPHR